MTPPKGAPPVGETAKDRRNRQRREARKAAKANGNGAAPADDGKVVEVPAELALGVFVVCQRGEDGATISVLGAIGQGDVRPAEVLSILERACTVERRKLET